MTPEVIKEIVESVIDQKSEYYNFYLLGAIVISVLIAYFISYFKEKAKNLAIKEDIQEITNKVESIKHDYNKQLEEFKQEQLIKYKSEVIAELFSEWLSWPKDRKRLNQLSFEAFLWLPDEICNELSSVLSHKPNAKTFRDIHNSTRKYLLKETTLEAWKVIYFPTKIEQGENMKKLELEKIKIKIKCGKCNSILILDNTKDLKNPLTCFCGEIYQKDSSKNKIFETFDNLKAFIEAENNSTERISKFSLVIEDEETK